MPASHSDSDSTPPQRISNGYAIWIGSLWITVPVLTIMIGGWSGIPLLALRYVPNGPPIGALGAGLALAAWVILPFVLAWTWWSLNVPKWRIWVLERTDDWLTLERSAIGAGLIWDENAFLGKLFARTEIWTVAQRRREADLRLRHRLSPKDS